jgi:redox-sensitive bicupin YhaK (pirin superfamily)
MKSARKVSRIQSSRPTLEGAGVRLMRAFADDDPLLDPFLLLDDFHSNDPRDYLAGFPWHPHRGIETITYMLHGEVAHGDSLGNQGVIRPGEVQWMTAGSGIIHSEMPQEPPDRLLWGFQLWANLPAAHKMMDPRYREVTRRDIPEVNTREGAKIKIICGQVEGGKGPVQDIVTEPEYLDVMVIPGAEFRRSIPTGHNVLAYVIEGSARFGADRQSAQEKHLVVFDQGEEVSVSTDRQPVRFLLVSGRPIREPVAWRGPIVMNSEAELDLAFEEYQNGTFLKYQKKH